LRLAHFVADSLLEALAEREHFDPETAKVIRIEVHRRLSRTMESVSVAEAGRGEGQLAEPQPYWKQMVDEAESPWEAANSLHEGGVLDALKILDALTAGDNDFVMASLSILSGMPIGVVEKIVSSRSAKGIVALAWKAKLPERLLPQLQNTLAHVSPEDILKPRTPGAPLLSKEEMTWQLEFFYQLTAKGGA
jgi:hypothetical protein